MNQDLKVALGIILMLMLIVVLAFSANWCTNKLKADDSLTPTVCHQVAEPNGSRGIFLPCEVDRDREIVTIMSTTREWRMTQPGYAVWDYVTADEGICNGINPREILSDKNRNVLYTASEISRANACLPLQKAGMLE